MSNSTSSFQCPGIAPNPDIAGIGVRIAIYAQALLSIVYPISFGWDGDISSTESKKMSRLSISITLTACALLLSTGIQAATLGISLYHALIILQLSWINSMTFMTVHHVNRATRPIEAIVSLREIQDPQANLERLKSFWAPEALVCSLHFVVVGGMGLWIWIKIQTFGDQPECNHDTFLVILSKTVYVTHGPVIRRISLALYGISVVPVFNVYIISLVLLVAWLLAFLSVCLLILPGVACGRFFMRIFGLSAKHEARTEAQSVQSFPSVAFNRARIYFAIFGMTTGMIILIANTEQMIHRSSGIVQAGEGDWTLGQTLALVFLFFPIWQTMGEIWGTDRICGLDEDEDSGSAENV